VIFLKIAVLGKEEMAMLSTYDENIRRRAFCQTLPTVPHADASRPKRQNLCWRNDQFRRYTARAPARLGKFGGASIAQSRDSDKGPPRLTRRQRFRLSRRHLSATWLATYTANWLRLKTLYQTDI
jgi:hypothetical protein